MRIGFFLQNNKKGGLDTFLINLIKNWPEEKDKLILFCNKSHPGLNNIEKESGKNLELIKYDILSLEEVFSTQIFPNLISIFIKLFFLLLSFPYAYIKLKPIILSKNLDKLMVINGGYPGGEICRAASVVWGKKNMQDKAWHNFHNLVDIDKNINFHPVRLYNHIIDLLVKKYSKGFVSVSKACSKTLKNRKAFKTNNPKFIYNGANVHISKNSYNFHEKFGLNPKSKIILMLAVYEKRKGHDFIFKVMDQLLKKNKKDIFLFIFGDGNDKEINSVRTLKTKFSCSKNIYLNKYVKDVSSLIKASDLLVIPSQKHESFGYTAVEAMAHNVPVVSTDVGGLPEVILNEKTGYVVDRTNHNLFADKISFLLNNKAHSLKMGKEGNKRYNSIFRARSMSKNYRKLILS